MLISFKCIHCKGELETESTAAGAEVACPNCGKTIVVPKRGIGPGTTIGGFQIEKKLGAGGMGEVFLARQISMDRLVALKILPLQMGLVKELSERFLHELRLLAKLAHPNIVTAYRGGRGRGCAVLCDGLDQG